MRGQNAAHPSDISLKKNVSQRYGLKSEIGVSCSSCHERATLQTSKNCVPLHRDGWLL
jgi:hypothetical protein